MWKDPIVQKVRRLREAHAAKFANDIKAIVEDARRRERESKRPVVNLAAKRPQPASKTA